MEKDKKSLKYNQILVATKELLWKFGFTRITVEEICKEAHVSKMTFYKFFKNKTAVTLTVMGNLYDEAHSTYQDIIDSDRAFTEKLRAMSNLKLEYAKNLSVELVKDLISNPDHELMALYEKVKGSTYKMLVDFFENAQEAGEMRKGIKMEFIIYMLDLMTEVCVDDKLLQYYKDEEEVIREMTDFFFYGIVSNKAK